MTWYVATTVPQREFEAVEVLGKHGIEAFAPLEYRVRQVGSKRTGKKQVRPYPLLSRYLFVKSANWGIMRQLEFPALRSHAASHVKRRAGIGIDVSRWPPYPVGAIPDAPIRIIRGYLATERGPLALSDAEVARIRAMSTDGPPRTIPLGKSFRPGEEVEIVEGPFKGYRARVDRISRGRASLAVPMFGTAREIEFDLSALEAA